MKKIILLTIAFNAFSCNQILDSFKKESDSESKFYGTWVQPVGPNNENVQGFKLENNHKISGINYNTLEYLSWNLENDKLTIVERSIGTGKEDTITTNYDVAKINDTILELKNGTIVQQYHRQ